ncbi:MAG: N-acetyl-alpha-D-glucosaminyl L-malate synthase BshA [Thermoanaerobaculia bacterium]
MRIGVTCYPTFGGSGVVATELGHELAKRGHEIHFITYAMPSRLNVFAERVSYHEVSVPSYPLFQYAPYDLALATRMGDVALHEGLDLIHVHYALPHAISAYLAREMLRPHRVAVVTTLHGTDITIVGQDRSYLPVTRFGIEQSDGVTAVSDYLKRVTDEVFAPKKEIDVIPNFIDPHRWTAERRPQVVQRFTRGSRRIVMHVSNFRPVKRVLDVVGIFDRIQKRVPATLLMIGDGPDRPAAEARCRELGIAGSVFFLGNIPALEEIMPSADLYLLPSDSESFGLSALEAQACGVPVLGYAVGGLPEVVTAETGFLGEVGDLDTLAEEGTALLLDPERHREMSRAARQRAAERFNPEVMVAKYLAVYERVLATS